MDKKRASKFMSLILRHEPERISIDVDEFGWADLDTLTSRTGIPLDTVMDIMGTDAKHRFEIANGKIRATYGHSIDVRILDADMKEPPPTLFHGTQSHSLAWIARDGILPRGRVMVCLATNEGLALQHALRHGKAPICLYVDSYTMHQQGWVFTNTKDSPVWCVSEVPVRFIVNLPAWAREA